MRGLGYEFGQDWSGGGMYYGSGPITTSPFVNGGMQQFSFGGVLKDFGDWIVTTGGEVLKTVIDQFGRRIVQKTGEILAPTPVGAATVAASYGTLSPFNPLVLVGGAVLLALALGRRR